MGGIGADAKTNFARRLRMLISFRDDMDIQLILELKNSFKKYHPVFPTKNFRDFFETLCISI